MRARALIIAVLLAATPVAAQLPDLGQPPQPQGQIGLPAPEFAFFRCACTTTPGAPLPSRLSFAPPPSQMWNGNVYASSDQDAASKARRVCTSERRGGLFDCVNCRCGR